MREPTKQEATFVRETIDKVFMRNCFEEWQWDMLNPYLLEIFVPVSVGKDKAVKAFNELFHALGVLPENENIGMSECRDYCGCCVNEDVNEDEEAYRAIFNVPFAKEFKECDEEYQYTLKAINAEQEAEAEAEKAEIEELISDIKTGRIKSKSPDGYLVLKAAFYDAIKTGKKKIEYRDFTEYNLKRTIGIKTIRFNRGYVKNAPQMCWEVEKVMLQDCYDNECDPFNVPEDFWPTTIAIHLGRRI